MGAGQVSCVRRVSSCLLSLSLSSSILHNPVTRGRISCLCCLPSIGNRKAENNLETKAKEGYKPQADDLGGAALRPDSAVHVNIIFTLSLHHIERFFASIFFLRISVSHNIIDIVILCMREREREREGGERQA